MVQVAEYMQIISPIIYGGALIVSILQFSWESSFESVGANGVFAILRDGSFSYQHILNLQDIGEQYFESEI